MDRRQDGTAAAVLAAGLVPARGESIAKRSEHAAEGRATRREAAGRPPPVSFLPDGTATGAAMRDTGSARPPFARPTLPPSRHAAERRGRAHNATTEILTR
jgi:hypothetical protein